MAATTVTPQIDNARLSERLKSLRMVWEAVDMAVILVVAGGGCCRLMTNEEVHLPCQTEARFLKWSVSLFPAMA